MKRNMESVLQAIQNRLKIEAGYAGNSYDLLGFTWQKWKLFTIVVVALLKNYSRKALLHEWSTCMSIQWVNDVWGVRGSDIHK
jgi:hypothetical protein